MKFYQMVFLTVSLSISCFATGDSLYKSSCTSCHGVKGETKAMGKAQAIQGMKSAAVVKALNEYGSGIRQSTLPVTKAIKSKFITTHSEKEIQEVADYISKL